MRRMLEKCCIELVNLAMSVIIVLACCALVAMLLWGLRQVYVVEPRHRARYEAEMAAIEAQIRHYDFLLGRDEEEDKEEGL